MSTAAAPIYKAPDDRVAWLGMDPIPAKAPREHRVAKTRAEAWFRESWADHAAAALPRHAER